MKRISVLLWFVLLTVALSFAGYFLPLPVETRALLVPVVIVLVPAIVSLGLVLITGGRQGLSRLFFTASGGPQWLLVAFLFGVGLRLAVLVAGLLLGTSIKPDFTVPGTWFVIAATIPLAFFEELGWRRFALDRLLEYRSPFEAALLLGVPWALIHLVILLPGMMNVGAPATPQTIQLLSLGVFLTWVYVRSGRSLLAITLLHGAQNAFVVLNRGLSMYESTWLNMWVYLVLAAILVLADRRMFFTTPS